MNTDFSYLNGSDSIAIEELYQNYLQKKDSVDATWKQFFQGFEFAQANYPVSTTLVTSKEFDVVNLIQAYRSRGHLFTATNPVRQRRKYEPSLDIANFNLTAKDLETVFHAGTLIGLGDAKLKDIVAHLQKVYCSSIGVEYMYIRNQEVVKWFQEHLEQKPSSAFTPDEKRHILEKLNQAVVFENFLDKKFVGQKRFSIEGCEALIPALDAIIEKGSDTGIQEFIMGMSHRGRLNVLVNTLGKPYSKIFTEFEGKEYESAEFSGDVKYHLGYSTEIETLNKKTVKLTLSPNPSHLEAVDPVVEGITRAKADFDYANDYTKIAPILIHGDAAVAGQGVVYEVIQMAKLDAYKTGGTLHIVVNNQVGFTTNYTDARSSIYCTDVAKVILSPVFHVNADDVEAVIQVVRLAIAFRQKFHSDVFIDLLGYRKYGHNEGDEPRFTQPILYRLIEQHPNPREIYVKKLMEQGVIEQTIAKEMDAKFRAHLQEDLDIAKTVTKNEITPFLESIWQDYPASTADTIHQQPDTKVTIETLNEIAKTIYTIPADKKLFKKMEKVLQDRQKMVESTNKLDWAMGELLAYGTLLREGNSVRFTGQDVERGTFSHRHAVLKLEESEEEYIPLATISTTSKFEIYNSLLSEYAVMGFEYGYAFVKPDALTIWEAQFGDFNNGAQIMIDQFISSGEDKWKSQNGLVLLLPHGYEGQGAEHSSARIERFLNLCAEDNLFILNCSTPANMFHALRRQVKGTFRKPLVVFTPKSLLRHPECVSSIEDFATNAFQTIIDDASVINKNNVNKLVFCSGKIYYDLLAKQRETGNKDMAIIRLEQLYPLDDVSITNTIATYPKNCTHTWIQEEPANMGAWGYLLRKWKYSKLHGITRPESASPATGSSKRHAIEQQQLIEQLFVTEKV